MYRLLKGDHAMDEKEKRSYFLPSKIVELLDREADKHGYFREKVIAAAIASFLKSDPNARAAMFDHLDQVLKGKAK
jgi:hypothetical protein